MYYTGGDEPLVTPLETAQLAAQFTPEEVLATLEMHAASRACNCRAPAACRRHVGAEAPLEAQDRRASCPTLRRWCRCWSPATSISPRWPGGVTLDAGGCGHARRTARSPARCGSPAAQSRLPDLGVKLEEIDVALARRRQPGAEAAGLGEGRRAAHAATARCGPIEEGGPTGWVRIRGNKRGRGAPARPLHPGDAGPHAALCRRAS